MSSIQAYNQVLNEGPSLAELAANKVMKTTTPAQRTVDINNRIYAQWLELKNFFSKNPGPLQFMLACENWEIADLKAQDPTETIDIANYIEKIWNAFSKYLCAPSTSVGIYAYCSLYRTWEQEGLIKLWNVLTSQTPNLPKLKEVHDIEDWFEKPEHSTILDTIQSLDLIHCQLRAIPPQILKFSKLQNLNLYDNQLTAIPDWIGDLGQLQRLNLFNNQLTTIPDWIGDLGQLQHLDLSDNQLTTLSDRIGDLGQLEHLDLSDNQLTTLSDRIGDLRQLQRLNLSGNQRITIPERLQTLVERGIIAL